MNIQIVCAGNTPSNEESAWINEYIQRSQKFARITLIRIKEKSRSNETETAQATWEAMEEKIPAGSMTVLLDPKGKLGTTEDLAKIFQKSEQNFKAAITFVIGGSYGLPDDAKKEAHQLISLTPLTLPHRIALLVLTEQIYRVLTIRAGTPYHH